MYYDNATREFRLYSFHSSTNGAANLALYNGSAYKTITPAKIDNWDTAYGWGDHDGLYALAAHTHSYLPLTGGTINNGDNAAPLQILRSSATTSQVGIRFTTDDGLNVPTNRYFGLGTNGDPYWASSANITAGNKIWHAGNDGASSGLDADLLDGNHASAFALSTHTHDDRYYTETEVDTLLSGYSTTSHNHDSRYYTETEISNFFSGSSEIGGYNKSNWDTAYTWGDHDGLYAAASHNHDSRYYTETEVDTFLLGKASTEVATQSKNGLMSSTDKTKLDGIASGAEVNVQSDWNATSGDAFILNKPTLGTAAASDTTDFAAASHNHDDRYYTETESDGRYPRGVTINYSSVDTASSTDSWYKFFQITDSGNSPVICYLRGYAHSSVAFIVSEGYLGQNAHVQILDYLTSTNNSYKWIKGVRIISNGDVEVLLNGGSIVSLEMTIIGDASYVSVPTLSSASAADVKDSATGLTNGMIRAKGDVFGANLSISNWNTAYTHSQAAHAPSNAEQNVQSDWNEAEEESDAYILNKPTLGTAAAADTTDFAAASHTHSYLPLAGGTVDGTLIIDTDTGTQPFYITRSGGTSQAVSIYVDDNFAVFESIQDENVTSYGSFRFIGDAGAPNPVFEWNHGAGTNRATLDYGTGDFSVSGSLTDGNGTINSAAYKAVTYFATATHSHDASDINSGTFDAARIPDLSGTYAVADHTHPYLPLGGGTITGQVIFPSGATTKPVLPNGFISRNDLDDTSGRHDIWGISERYYPSSSTASDAWGIQWSGSPNDIVFVGAGTDRVTISLDEGNITTLGSVTANGGNSAQWNTAYGWGDHDGLYAAASHSHDTADSTTDGFLSAGDYDKFATAFGWGDHSGLYLPIGGGTITRTSTHVTQGSISASNAHLDLYNNWQSNTDQKGSILTFTDNYFDGTNYIKTTRAAIKGGTDTIGNTADGYLEFYVDSAGANSPNLAMRMASNGSINISGYGTEGAYLQSNGSFRIDIDSDNDHTDRAFIVSRNGAANDLFYIKEDGNVGIGTTSPTEKLDVNGNVRVNGTLEATEKSFNIEHPTKPGKRLIYGVLEGPEHAVYVRGRATDGVIELPEEWTGLVDESTITVQLTPIGRSCAWVEDVKDNKVYYGIDHGHDCFYFVQATRKDVPNLITERDA